MNLRNLKKVARFSSVRKLSKNGYENVLDIHPKVKHALEHDEPIVALESTIITHGMPYPQNLETALEVENTIKTVGATPATIACINGRLKVGLCNDNLSKLAKMNTKDIVKTSRRDLSYVISSGKCGGTTVAATMIVAHMAGIRIFATGGVGGVHRDGHITMDVSADLIELGRTPVTVVSSGVKSILDIPRTLEYLETQGVCVATLHSEVGNFPDFYTRDSGCKAPYNLESPLQAANLIKALHHLKLQSGILIAVPIPHEYAVDKDVINAAIDHALKFSIDKGIKGKDLTPFLLAAVSNITMGTSLVANIALIKNNAKVAAQIACELSKRVDIGFPSTKKNDIKELSPQKPLIIGASMLDFCLSVTDDIPLSLDGATYHARVEESAGGVGRNLADAISKLYGAVNFISVVGKDHTGRSLLELIPESVRTGILIDNEKPTSICSILFDKLGNCKMCLANMEIHKTITPQVIKQHEAMFKRTPLVVIDGNLSENTIQTILEISHYYNKPVFFEPTDMLIAGRPFKLDPDLARTIRIITPNVFELKVIAESITTNTINWDPASKLSSRDSLLTGCNSLLKLIERKFDCIIVTLGAHGVLVNIRGNSFDQIKFDQSGFYIINSTDRFLTRFYTAPSVEKIVNVSGAGDSFSSGFITGLLRGLSINDCVSFGFIAAKRSLQSNSAVPGQYFKNRLEEQKLLHSEINSLKFKDLVTH